MSPSFDLLQILLVGLGATALMDVWLLLLQRLGVPTTGFALIGRWVGHLLRGRWRHEGIAKSPPVAHEAALGWSLHYALGMSLAGLLVWLCGTSWLSQPTWGPALTLGAVSLILPLCVMQPAMGAGLAARRTATPWRNNLRSLANHLVFGVGLYLTAQALRLVF